MSEIYVCWPFRSDRKPSDTSRSKPGAFQCILIGINEREEALNRLNARWVPQRLPFSYVSALLLISAGLCLTLQSIRVRRRWLRSEVCPFF